MFPWRLIHSFKSASGVVGSELTIVASEVFDLLGLARFYLTQATQAVVAVANPRRGR
jgi:hypothetical protein